MERDTGHQNSGPDSLWTWASFPALPPDAWFHPSPSEHLSVYSFHSLLSPIKNFQQYLPQREVIIFPIISLRLKNSMFVLPL